MASPKRFTFEKCGFPPPPVETEMASEPYLSDTSSISVATSVSASSHEMRSHWFASALAHSRRMGYLLRFG